MNGYELTRKWFDFKFENVDKCKSIHTDLYMYIVDLWNRLGNKEKFGLPTQVTMELLGIGSYNTYKKIYQDLVDWKFIIEVQKSKNQYQSRVIALSKNDKASDKALDKSNIRALDEAPNKASDESSDVIDKQSNKVTKEQERGGTKKKSYRFKPPSQEEVYDFLIYKKLHPTLAKKEAKKYFDFYESKNWYVGKNKMKNWKAAASGWINRMDNFKPNSNGNSNSKSEPTVNRQTAETIRSNSEGW